MYALCTLVCAAKVWEWEFFFFFFFFFRAGGGGGGGGGGRPLFENGIYVTLNVDNRGL